MLYLQPANVLLAALVALCTSTGQVALAHEQNEAYTTILFNQHSENLEVTHRFSTHDAEHALIQLFGKDADILQNTETQKDFAAYVKLRFQLQNHAGESLMLADVGYEVEGKYFWVYQEMPIPENLSSLRIKMQALQEVWPEQTNYVNVEKDGLTRSVRLGKGDGWKTILLPTS